MNIRKKELGFIALVSMVIGSQVGSGTFNLPSILAPYKTTGLWGWLLAVPIAICLAIIFSNLSSRLPKSGGPHVYVAEAFGRKTGFFTAWSYWLVSWSSNSVILVTIVNYLSTITGELSTFQTLAVESLVLLFVTCANLRGLKFSGVVETILAILKVLPLLLLPVLFFMSFDSSRFSCDNLPAGKESVSSVLSATALLAFWGFIGIECATTPASSVKNPKKTLPRAIIAGTLCAALIYIINIISIVGVVGFDKLSVSHASYAVAMDAVFGNHSDTLISVFIIMLCIGTLNSWTLSGSQMAYGAYYNGLFPKSFGKVNKFGVPIAALVFAALGTLPFLIFEQISKGGLSDLTDMMCSVFLYVYLICCFAHLKLINKWYKTSKEKLVPRVLSCFAIAGCLFVLSQSVVISIVVIAIFIALGIPVFIRCKDSIKNKSISDNHRKMAEAGRK
ncbi:MAG: APC family permease [Holosporales bacterium]|jgi:APA family basic amino acid/polyamine antiporter|nr:APC family permease [Holosporales bacterium]